MPFECIDIDEAKSLIESEQATVVDIRDHASFSQGAIDNAIHLDNNSLGAFLESADFERPLIVCCYHGNMSKGAADFFNNQGFARSFSLNGGYSAWAKQS